MRQVSASAGSGSSGCAGPRPHQRLQRQRRPVTEAEKAPDLPGRRRPVPKQLEDLRPHVGVDAPSAGRRRVRPGRAPPAGLQGVKDRPPVSGRCNRYRLHRRRRLCRPRSRPGRPLRNRHRHAGTPSVASRAATSTALRATAQPGRNAGSVTSPARAEEFGKARVSGIIERQERLAQVTGGKAHQLECCLDRDGVRAALEVGPEERQPARVNEPGALPVAGPSRPAQGSHLGRDLVRGDADHAVPAHGQDRERPGVVPCKDGEPRRTVAQDGGDLIEVPGRLLHPGDHGVLGEAKQRAGLDVRPGARRHVVDDDRKAALVGHGPVVRLEHALVGAVVVGSDHERGVGAEPGGPSGRPDGRGGVVRPGPGQDRGARPAGSAARSDLDRDRDHPLALGERKRGRLAGGAAGHDAIDPGPDLPGDEPPQSSLVERSVGREWGDEGGERAAKPGSRGRRGRIRTRRSHCRTPVVSRSPSGLAPKSGWVVIEVAPSVGGSCQLEAVAEIRSLTTDSNGWRPAGRGVISSQPAEASAPAT